MGPANPEDKVLYFADINPVIDTLFARVQVLPMRGLAV